MKILGLLILSYLLGSIPTGYVLTHWLRGIDLRNYGSGNVGATNVARVLGYKYGGVVALVDILKGYFSVFIIQMLLPADISILIIFLAGFLAVLGHDYSIFIKFTGGKGVATSVGVILRIMPFTLIFLAIIWLAVIIITRYVSLGSILGAALLPIIAIFYYDITYVIYGIILGLLVIFTHRSNIKRLLRGEENKLGSSH